MPQRSFMAAKTVASLCNFDVTNLKLQKLLYLAHMMYLGRYKKGLIDGHFEAWNLGPVEPDIYHRLKAYGNSKIQDVFGSKGFPKNSNEYRTIKSVIDQLGDASASRLVQITHRDFGAWAKNFNPKIRGIRISDDDISEEYETRRERAMKRRAASENDRT